jgi:hypothetical protein
MNEGEVSDIPQVSLDENSILTAAFPEEEVFEAISQMEHNKAQTGFQRSFINIFGRLLMLT